MAEVAAVAWAAEEAVSTTVQVGVGAYMVSKPTMPLKSTFHQIATSSDDETKLSLCRSGHTLSIVKNKAYIFGGETAASKLASSDIHAITLTAEDKSAPDYSVIPAIADDEASGVPVPRQKHAACSFNICVAIFGGLDESGQVIDEQHAWLFVTGKSAWEPLKPKDTYAPSPPARSEAFLFDNNNLLVLYGGKGKNGEALKDVWLFDYGYQTWHQLPDAPTSSSAAALTNGFLHVIENGDNMSSNLHVLTLSPKDKSEQTWHTISFPTNPLTPGPRPRSGAGLIPVSTGYGRNYLIYLFGVREAGKDDEEPLFWSDMWTYQLPSTEHEAKLTTSIAEAIKPAKIKDSIRSALGFETGGHSWTETVVEPPAELDAVAGKVHPGPRGYFAYDVTKDKQSIVLWGGINAKGEKEGDGWLIRLQ